MAICDDCKTEYTPSQDDRSLYEYYGTQYGVCLDCQATRVDGMLRTVAQLEVRGHFAWPGGYPFVWITDGSLICFNCAKNDIENGDGPIGYQVEDSDQKFYGGVQCDGCGEEIVEAECPECMDALYDDTPLLYADNVAAWGIHALCAEKLVAAFVDSDEGNLREGSAFPLHTGGIEIARATWYARAGVKYCPR